MQNVGLSRIPLSFVPSCPVTRMRALHVSEGGFGTVPVTVIGAPEDRSVPCVTPVRGDQVAPLSVETLTHTYTFASVSFAWNVTACWELPDHTSPPAGATIVTTGAHCVPKVHDTAGLTPLPGSETS